MHNFDQLAEQEFTMLAQSATSHDTPDTCSRTDVLTGLVHRVKWLEKLCRELHALLESVPFEPVSDPHEKDWYERVESAHQHYLALFQQGEQPS